MKKRNSTMGFEIPICAVVMLSILTLLLIVAAPKAFAQQASTPPQPVVAVHISEFTQALETMPAKSPTPTGSGTTGNEWWYTSWHYFVAHESLKEALRSDGTPFVEITDADIAAGTLLFPDGSPRYPIVISLASEAISDTEIAPLCDYVSGGGFLLVGSSAFTRNLDGTTRGDFALASEMGVHMIYSSLNNWDRNYAFYKSVDHPLVSNIPDGGLYWYMPLFSEEIPWGVSPSHVVNVYHYDWLVDATDATVIAYGYSTPFLTVKQYGNGNFIYHSEFQPLIGHGAYDSGMYAYLIFRNAIKWAFEAANVPIIKLSPWRYQYDAAFVVRHDLENYQDMIRSIEASSAFEQSVGAKGDYYFCTGTLRQQMADKNTVVASLGSAVSMYGATIGSHNGGLKNPVNLSLSLSDLDYWHWGPDEALDVTPTGYANGKAYAEASMSMSYGDIESWMAGFDNGRSGCGATNSCPRTWVGPYFNSTREDSYDILEQLGVVTAGEQKISPFPHWTVSTQTAGKRYEHLTLPVSEWYSGSSVLQSLEYHNSSTMTAAVDFYYNLGALINVYGHNISSSGTLQGQYASYCAAKPKVWATNAVGVYDWWTLRSQAIVTPAYSLIGNISVAQATISNITDINTAVEVVIPGWNGTGQFQVYFDGSPANSSDYRITQDGIRVRAGAAASSVEVRYSSATTTNIALALSPTSVVGGSTSTGTVTLSAPAPTGGAVVALSSNNTSAATVPASVTIASGSTTATFSITTYSVSSSTSVTITASYAGTTKTATLTVTVTPVLTSISVSPASASVVTNSTQQFTATAKDQFGNSLVPQPAFTWTVSGGGTIASSGLFTAGSTAGGPYTVMASSGSVSGTASVTVTAASTFTIGETSILGIGVNGIANLLVAQQVTLGQTATISSMSFYVTTASGNLRLGIYDATGPGNGPGQLKAQTAAFAPTSGWNTRNVVSQVSLPAGTYWLAFLPSSNSLAVRGEATGSLKYYSYSYGALPATFSTSPVSQTAHFSFYATF